MRQGHYFQLCNASNNIYENNTLVDYIGIWETPHIIFLRDNSNNNTFINTNFTGSVKSDLDFIKVSNSLNNRFLNTC